MDHQVRQIKDLPTIENTQLATQYQYTTPQFSTDTTSDLLIHYGSQFWIIELDCELISETNRIRLPFCGHDQVIPIENVEIMSLQDQTNGETKAGSIKCMFPIWIFILNESLILNFNDLGLIFKIPYELVSIAGISQQGKLYLNLEHGLSHEDIPTECQLYPGSNNVGDLYPLFREFAGFTHEQAIRFAYSCLNECIGLTSNYKDSDEEFDYLDDAMQSNKEGNKPMPSEGGSRATQEEELKLYELGQADDELNDDLLKYHDDGTESGMYVELGTSSGVKRTRDDEEDSRKNRKVE